MDNTLKIEISEEYKKKLIKDFIEHCVESEVSPSGRDYGNIDNLIEWYLKEKNSKEIV